MGLLTNFQNSFIKQDLDLSVFHLRKDLELVPKSSLRGRLFTKKNHSNSHIMESVISALQTLEATKTKFSEMQLTQLHRNLQKLQSMVTGEEYADTVAIMNLPPDSPALLMHLKLQSIFRLFGALQENINRNPKQMEFEKLTPTIKVAIPEEAKADYQLLARNLTTSLIEQDLNLDRDMLTEDLKLIEKEPGTRDILRSHLEIINAIGKALLSLINAVPFTPLKSAQLDRLERNMQHLNRQYGQTITERGSIDMKELLHSFSSKFATVRHLFDVLKEKSHPTIPKYITASTAAAPKPVEHISDDSAGVGTTHHPLPLSPFVMADLTKHEKK